jgi:hypothetical protein
MNYIQNVYNIASPKFDSLKGKGKFHTIKIYRESKGTGLLILNFGTGWR